MVVTPRKLSSPLLIAFAIWATSCGRRDLPPEPSFSEHFGVSVDLPMPEAEFIELLNARNIGYEITDNAPQPRDAQLADGRTLSHTIKAYGAFDHELGRMAGYQAYVDANGDVLFIENYFSYVAVIGPCFFGSCG